MLTRLARFTSALLLVVGVAASRSYAAGDPVKVALDQPAIYLAHLRGDVGWDLTPDLLANLFMDADYTLNDLIGSPNAGPREPDRVVNVDAWAHHVVVLRIDLGLDERATQIDLAGYVERFQRVLSQQANLRNRRVALWITRADDVAALVLGGLPGEMEVLRTPTGTASLTPEFVERYTDQGGAEPEAPDLGFLPECSTFDELKQQLAMPEETEIVYGRGQYLFDRWNRVRDEALEKARTAVGEEWDTYERTLDDPNADVYDKRNARREVEKLMRDARQAVERHRDLATHPVFAPLLEQIREHERILARTPEPRRGR